MYDMAKPGKAPQSGFLMLEALVGIPEFAHGMGSFWLILLSLLVVGLVWFALATYADHLVGEGRYHQALRIAKGLRPLKSPGEGAVSYTHLTLPTILRV